MYARVTRTRVASADVDEAVRLVTSSIVPAAKEQPGFRGFLHLVDRTSGEGIAISLWASEADMRSGETGPYYHAQIDKVRSLLSSEPIVDGYEVAVAEGTLA